MDKHNKPQQAADTGHEWDGIRELTNPPPRWWMIALHASWIWCVVYFILYPSIPLLHDSTKGILGWTMIKEYKEAVAENDAVKAPYLKKIAAMSGKEILADPGMRNFAESSAKAIFGDNCAACHGAGGQGAPGLFPVLADDDWLYGGDFDTIVETITNGRQGFMPAHEGMLDEATINKLADFVIDASQGKATPEQFALFNASGCGGCHGENAKGGAINKLGYRCGQPHRQYLALRRQPKRGVAHHSLWREPGRAQYPRSDHAGIRWQTESGDHQDAGGEGA